MPLYYCINEPADPALQAFTARFDSEIDRDNYVSDRPDVRRACDPPEDTCGFQRSAFGWGFGNVVNGEFRHMERTSAGIPAGPERSKEIMEKLKEIVAAPVIRLKDVPAAAVTGDPASHFDLIHGIPLQIDRIREAYATFAPVPSVMNYRDEEIIEQRRDFLGLARLAAHTSLSREDLAAEARRILGLHGLI